MGLLDPARVDATPHLRAWDQLAVENGRVGDYHDAAGFLESYATVLTSRRDLYQQHLNDLKGTRWQSAAATEFYRRAQAGVDSINAVLGADLPKIAKDFRDTADAVADEFGRVNDIRETLSGNGSVVERDNRSGGGELPSFRLEGTSVVVDPPGHRDWAEQLVRDSEAAAKRVITKFEALVGAMAPLRQQKWTWDGPVRATTPAPGPRSAGPGGAPGGSPGGGPGEAPGGGPGGMQDKGAPGGDQGAATDMPGAEESTSDLGTELPAGGPSGIGESAPPTDPELAGLPTASTPPPPSSAPTVPVTTPGPVGGPNGGPAPSPLPFATGGPLPPVGNTGQSTSRPRNSTVDGRPGSVPGGGMPATEEPTVRPVGGRTGASSGSAAGGGGFFPPMVPPMAPAGGARGGVKPGEADFAGGLVRRAGGRDARRAGLAPQLLGRTGDDEESADNAPVRRTGDEVLDEELWQVPGAAPAVPGERRPRRDRSWGP